MDTFETLAHKIHDSGMQGVIAITGGGLGAFNLLCRFGGASKMLLEGHIPYATESFQEYVNGQPEKWVSAEAARQLAMVAFQRAQYLSAKAGKAGTDNLFGLASSASLVRHEGERPGRTHRVAIAFHSSKMTHVIEYHLKFDTRPAQEDATSELILYNVAKAVGFIGIGEHTDTRAVRAVFQQTQQAQGEWPKLYKADPFACYGDGRERPHSINAILPGSFNPKHEGHEEMQKVGIRRLKVPVLFELSIANVDKPTLDYISIAERVKQFHHGDIILTNAPLAETKARLFPDSTILVGMDTWNRIINPKYYGGSFEGNLERMGMALKNIKALSCRFLVFGRMVDGVFKSLDDNTGAELGNTLKMAARSLADAVTEEEFHRDISSTELRAKAKEIKGC